MSMQIKAARYTTGGGMAGRVRYGDPGFLGGLWGGIKGAVGGLVSGGPIGAITGAVGGAIKGSGGGPKPAVAAPSFMPGSGPMAVVPSPGFGGAVARAIPGGKTGYQVAAPSTNGGPPRGYRLNKSGYFTKDGVWHDPGTKYVKVRRRNSMNPRALSRAMARLEGAKGIQRKLSGFTTPRYTSGGKRKSAASCR